jgi:hypothetical protein
MTDEHDLAALLASDNTDGLPRRREADGVGQQVEQDLPYPLPVRGEAADIGRRVDHERDAGLH